MNDRISWIEYKGAKILYVDYSGTSEDAFIKTIVDFKNELINQTPGSVVTLTNMTDAVVTPKVRMKLRQLTEQTQGISNGAAAIGLTGLNKTVALLIKRDLYHADSLEDAKEWLAEAAKNN